MSAAPLRDGSDDRCPGALRLHAADDGYVARVRVPGGRLRADQLLALADLADDLGDGELHLTSRGNLQVRGLGAAAGETVATRLAAAGLLPSLAHDRVRNVVASPGADLDAELVALDAALVAEPRLAELSGRFLFGIDAGDGDVLALAPDLVMRRVDPESVRAPDPAAPDEPAPGWELVVAGHPTGRRGDPAALLVEAALSFLELRDAHAPGAWRLTDLTGPAAAACNAVFGLPSEAPAGHPATRTPRYSAGRAGATTAWVPLGVLPASAWRVLASVTGRLHVTPWRSVVLPDLPDLPHRPDLPDLPAPDAEAARRRLADAGFDLAEDSLWARTSACIGTPGCSRALADVRSEAADLAAEHPGRRVHVSGCERRCGHPLGPHLDLVATGRGYDVQERP
ncbi:precorrin-3B synthase [Nocardioides sp.]|uniref:precorrin-3B synthase n=1 Tax=Nocardioides sp. TaxID=35761 RepID=UPI0027345031|nr:precorrin-3B synthase [Nocardioides sp.]MDP3892387.1 precorrin-3B synthase [Nocardioides sp.]